MWVGTALVGRGWHAGGARPLQMAGEGNDLAALIDYMRLELVIPENTSDLGVDVAMTFIPGGKGGKKAGKELFKNTDALRRHNKTVVKALGLNKDERQRLHREIHGLNLTITRSFNLPRSYSIGKRAGDWKNSSRRI